MARKRNKPEEIVNMLRQAEVLHGQGMSMADGIRQLTSTEVDYLVLDKHRVLIPQPGNMMVWIGTRRSEVSDDRLS